MEHIYLKLDGIKGESSSAQAKDEIEILAMSHGVSMPLTHAGGAGASVKHGRTIHQDVTITKYLDITSPTLNLRCSGGTNIKEAIISIYRADKDDAAPVKHYEIKLEDVIISHISISSSGDSLPIETLSLHYNKINWKYTKQKKDSPGGKEGDVTTGWDLEKNTKV